MEEVADGGTKEDLRDQEGVLLYGSGKGALVINGDHHWGFQVSREGQGGDKLCMIKGNLNISWRGTLGE